MDDKEYVLGYSRPILEVMERRTAESHARFFLPFVKSGFRVLDAGCGPGTITIGLARRVGHGQVLGIDIEDSQFGASIEDARRQDLNVTFRQADIYQLPFKDKSFDAVFSHAVFQHLGEPLAALAELRRVLKPGGVIGIRASDLGGMLIDSGPGGIAAQLTSYFGSRDIAHGDPRIGRKLPRFLNEAGFAVERVTASYEVVTDLARKFGPAIAAQLPGRCDLPEIQDSCSSSGLVALAWVEVVGHV